jgi:hypothetical protein
VISDVSRRYYLYRRKTRGILCSSTADPRPCIPCIGLPICAQCLSTYLYFSFTAVTYSLSLSLKVLRSRPSHYPLTSSHLLVPSIHLILPRPSLTLHHPLTLPRDYTILHSGQPPHPHYLRLLSGPLEGLSELNRRAERAGHCPSKAVQSRAGQVEGL